MMDLEKTLELYQGSKLQINQLSKYQQWSFSFFHDKEFVVNPHLSITLHIDLMEASNTYKCSFKEIVGASFQSYLIWNLAKALSLNWTFNTRKIDDEWYVFKNLPVYFPIAVGGEDRFKDVIIHDVALMNWETFARVYRDSIDNANADVGSLTPLTWSISHFIGNLPSLNFTSFQTHRGTMNAGRPVFYFGKRFNLQQKLTIPLSITFDHSNVDPYVLNELIETYQNLLTEGDVKA